ncbi:MAG TPA: hypothetical protein VLL25_12890 [Acidimicrobiales bacterium]|nr:hypothetical protein [Acidimicrobiales bacterium]
MANPFDPFGWLGGRNDARQEEAAESPLSPGWWLDEWLRTTAGWANPASWGGPAAGLAASPDRVLLDLVEGIAGRFAGQRLSIAGAGGSISVVLDSLQVQRRLPRWSVAGGERQLEMRVLGHDLDVRGWRFDDVEAVTQHVRLRLGLPTKLTAEGVDVVLRGEFERVLRHLAARGTSAWSWTPADNGLVMARSCQRPNVAFLVQPLFVGQRIRLEVLAVHWRGHRATVPRWLRLARSLPLPELPGGARLFDASVRDGMLTARLRYEAVGYEVDLDKLRGAVQRGETSLSVG